jgi:hypothetical protein
MAQDDAVRRILTDYWDDVWAPLDFQQRADLTSGIRELALRAADNDAAGPIVLRILRIVRLALPADHPGRQELGQVTRYAGATPPDWGQLTGVLCTLSARLVREQVHERLLRESGLSAAQVRVLGEDPERRFLIRLDTPTGEERIPAFQFGPDGRAIAMVLAVNESLEADADPWGVADWWLGMNVWLDARPADLIGRNDHGVRAAAAAAVAQDW